MVDTLNDLLSLEDEELDTALNNTVNTLLNPKEEKKEIEAPTFNPNKDVPINLDAPFPQQFSQHRTQEQMKEEFRVKEAANVDTTFVEKYKASAETMHLISLAANSDAMNEGRYEDDPNFKMDTTQSQTLIESYPKEWAEDIAEAKSQEELNWRMQRADDQLDNYKKLGEMGWSSGTAMLAAAVTDPVTLGLSFATAGLYVPAAAARGVQYASQTARYLSYAKRGAVVGSVEGAAIGAAAVALDPVGEMKDMGWFMVGGAVGGSLGGALGAKFRKSLDLEMIQKNGGSLTQKGKVEFEEQTPLRQQQSITDANKNINGTSKLKAAQRDGKKSSYVPVPQRWLDHDQIDLPTTPKLLNNTPDKFAKLSDDAALDVIDDTYGLGSLYRAQINKIKQGAAYIGMEKDIAAIRKQMNAFVREQWATKSSGELEARAFRAFLLKPRNTTKQQRNYDNAALKNLSKAFDKDGNFVDAQFEFFKRSMQFKSNRINNRNIDGTPYVIRPWQKIKNGVGDVLSISDGKKIKYFTIATKGKKTGYFTSDEFGNPKQFISSETRKNGDAPWNAVRKVYKHRAATAEEELALRAEEDLLIAFGDKKLADLTDEDVPTLSTGVVGRNLSALQRAGASEIPQVRALAFKLGLVASGLRNKAGETVDVGMNAASIQDNLKEGYMAVWQQLNIKHKVNSNRMFGTNKTEGLTPDELEDNIWHLMNGSTPKYNVTQLQKDLVKDRRILYTAIYDDAAANNAVDLPAKLTDYMTRQFRHELVHQMLKQFDEADLEKTFARMILKNVPYMPKNVAIKTGAAYLKGIRLKVLDSSLNKGNRIVQKEAYDRDSLQSLFDAAAKDDPNLKLTDEQLESVIDAFNAENRSTRSKSPNIHARARMNIDDKGIYQVKLKGSDQTAPFTLTDIMETNAERSFITYSWKMSGASALAKVGIDSEQSYASMINSLKPLYKDQSGDIFAAHEAEVEALNYMYDSIRGSFIAKGNLTEAQDNFLRRTRELAFIVQMGQAGFAAMVETSNVAFEHGVLQFMRQFPDQMSLWRRAASGKLVDDVLADMEAGGTGGTDILSGFQVSRFEDSELNDILRSKFTQTDKKLAVGRRLVSMAGLLSPVTVALTRTHQRIMVQHFFDMFKKGNLNVYKDVKLKSLGLNKEKLQNIKNMFDKYAEKHTTGYSGLTGRVKTINAELWKATPEGKQAYDDFIYAVGVDTKNTIQRSHIGSGNALVRSSAGKSLFQFLSYPIAAHTQQYNRQLFRVQNGDMTPVKILMGGISIASGVYIAKVYQRTLGMSSYDKKKYLEKHLTLSKIISSALMYQGMFGAGTILTTGMRFGDPFTQFTDVVAPPVLSYVATTGQVVSDAIENTYDGTPYTTEEIKKASKLGGNFWLFQVLGNVAAEEFGD